MAKSKAKNAKRAKNAVKHNSVEAEKAKAAKKGEDIVDDEELENVVEDEEIEDEELDEEEDVEEEDEDSEEDNDDEEEEDEDEDEDEEDENESEDEDSEDDEDSEEDEDLDEEDDEDEEEEDEDEDEEEIVEKKAPAVAKKAKASYKNNVKKKAPKATKAVKTKVISSKAKPSFIKTFFARKGDENENILTIFKDTRIIGAIIGEIFGTAVITMIALTLGLFNPLYMILAYIGITLAVVKLSGAHLNPIVTAGMMASRRVSAVRGVIYIISQILGSWLGYLVINGFYQAGINSGNIEAATSVLPTLTQTSEILSANADYSFFWAITMVEFIGAIIIAFFFARAQRVKENKVAFAITVSAGMFIAMLLAVVINSNFFAQQSNTFVLNPAVGMMYGIFPASAEGVDALMNALMPMLVTYVIFPIIGGVLGFYLSDFANLMEGKDLKDNVEE